MSTIDLPSLSDDELDYESTENDHNQQDNASDHGIQSSEIRARVSYDEEEDQADLYVDGATDSVRTTRLESAPASADKLSIANRVTRLGEKIKLTPSQIRDAQKFGIELKDDDDEEDEDPVIDSKQLSELYNSLDVCTTDARLRLNCVFCKGVDKMSDYEIEKIFAEFRPDSVQFVDESSCTIRWSSAAKVAQMLLQMTKP
uniref:Nuclear cap-binding protein subunit 3 n=1 Tax=Ditylenchus dipsaci TaxID=166011 RepID=A0A915CVA4_9BILA